MAKSDLMRMSAKKPYLQPNHPRPGQVIAQTAGRRTQDIELVPSKARTPRRSLGRGR